MPQIAMALIEALICYILYVAVILYYLYYIGMYIGKRYLAGVCDYGGRGANPRSGILHGAPPSLRLGPILGFLSPLFLLLSFHAGTIGRSPDAHDRHSY